MASCSTLSAYLLVKMEPMASRTASETRFSEGMSSRPVAWRLASSRRRPAICESTESSGRFMRSLAAVVVIMRWPHLAGCVCARGAGGEEILSDEVEECHLRRAETCAPPLPRDFWHRVRKHLKTNRLSFFEDTKNSKRVRNDLKRKNLSIAASDERPAAPLGADAFQNGNCWYTPRQFS